MLSVLAEAAAVGALASFELEPQACKKSADAIARLKTNLGEDVENRWDIQFFISRTLRIVHY